MWYVMRNCYVCGASVHESNWIKHIQRDKMKYGNNIFKKLSKDRDEFYNRHNHNCNIKEIKISDSKLNAFVV